MYIPPSLGDAYMGGAPASQAAYTGAMEVQSQQQQTSNAGAAIGAGASGLGSVLALVPKLLGEAKQRKFAKKMAKIKAQQEQEEYLEQLTNANLAEGAQIHQYDQAVPDLKADMNARGMGSSSVNSQAADELAFRQQLGLNAIRRARARLKSGRAADLKLASIQKKATKSAATYDTIAQVANAVGQVAGMAGGMAMSDKNKKKDISPVKTGTALEIVVATPVSEWKYKDDPAHTNVGPMAQDVNKTMGEEAAPGGKEINLVTMNGMLMAAVQELTKKVAELEKRL